MNIVAALLLSLMGTDRLGDPTAPGTLARYGTARMCLGDRNTAHHLCFHPIRDEVYAICIGGVTGWKLPGGAVCFHDPDARDILFDPTGRSHLIVRANVSEVWDEATNRRTSVVPKPPIGVLTPDAFAGGRLLAYLRFGSEGPVFVRVLEPDGRPTSCELRSGLTALRADGRSLWVTDTDRGELRAHSADTGGLQAWRPIPIEPNADLGWYASANAWRVVTVQFRNDTKADRYRGFPECFIRVMDATTRRTVAQYDFRLDDTDDGRPVEESDAADPFRSVYRTSDDGRFFAWKDRRGHLHIRHLPTGRVVTAPGIYPHTGMRDWAFHPAGTRLAVLDRDGILRLIDPHTGRFQHLADSPATAAKCVAVSSDGKLVATGHACGEVWMWDAATGKPLWHTEPDGHIWELRFSKDGTTLAAIGAWPALATRTFDAASGKPRGPQLRCASVLSVALTAGGKHLIDTFQPDTTGPERPKGTVLRVLEVATGNELRRTPLDHPVGYVIQKDAVVSADGRVIAVMHADGQAFAYDTATGKKRCRLVATKDGATNGRLAVSADGRLVAQFGYAFDPLVLGSGWLTVFDTERDGAIIFDGDPGGVVNGVAFSPDGRYLLAIAGESGRSVLCDLRSRATIRRWARAESALFPDGKTALALPGIRGAERLSLEPLAWKVAPPPKPDAARLKQLWTRLGEPDAMAAVFELARFPADAVPFLTAKLLAEPPDPKAVAAHVGDLGAKLYADREAATKALQALGPETLPALRAARKAETSPEARRRLDKLIAGHADPSVPFTLARLRAVEVLERCGTADGRAVLKGVAARAGTPWADDAARAVERK